MNYGIGAQQARMILWFGGCQFDIVSLVVSK